MSKKRSSMTNEERIMHDEMHHKRTPQPAPAAVERLADAQELLRLANRIDWDMSHEQSTFEAERDGYKPQDWHDAAKHLRAYAALLQGGGR